MQYYQYFRLKGPPFQPASPDGAVYLSPTHLEGLATLESGLSGDLTGLTLLTGEAGTGKTTLIYSLLQRDFKRVRIAHIDDPKLSFPEIMRLILTQLNLYSTGSTKLDHLEALDRFLALRGKEERIAIIVDESQILSDDVLEELRLLSNRGDRRLQLILVGHPELAERLKKPELRQLNQRISSRGVLNPLTMAQAVKYVECKLSAQGSSCAAIFDRGALKRLLRRSDGIPRKVNMLCHTAMQFAYNAGERKVSYKTANKTAADYHDSVKITKEGFGTRSLVVSAVGVGLAALLLLGFVYPKVESWKLNHTFAATEQTVRPVRAKQARPVEQVKPVEPAKPVEQVKALEPPKAAEPATPAEPVKPGEQPVIEGHPDSGAKPNAAAPPASQRAELRASLAPGTAASAAAKSDVAAPAGAPEKRIIPPAPAAPAAAVPVAATQKQTAVPAVPERQNQIAIMDGDTLEKIAIRYFGSKSGINELVAANPQLTDINRLTVGQIIHLPPGVTPKVSQDQSPAARPAPDAGDSPER
jgi:type II secretory pathway predicted ATPase ExeA/phage tail protein X